MKCVILETVLTLTSASHAVPVFEGSSRTSQIAFISNPRKASHNDLIKGKLRRACRFCLILPTRAAPRLVSYYRFQAAVQIAFLILVRTYVVVTQLRTNLNYETCKFSRKLQN